MLRPGLPNAAQVMTASLHLQSQVLGLLRPQPQLLPPAELQGITGDLLPLDIIALIGGQLLTEILGIDIERLHLRLHTAPVTPMSKCCNT